MTADIATRDKRRARLIHRAIRSASSARRLRSAGQDALAECAEHSARTALTSLRMLVGAR